VAVASTRHGNTIGYYIPAPRVRAEAERTAIKEIAARLQQLLSAEGNFSSKTSSGCTLKSANVRKGFGSGYENLARSACFLATRTIGR